MALLTYWHGRPQRVDDLAQAVEWIHPSSNLGVIFFLTLFLIILVTNFSVRGLASGIVIIGGTLVSVVLAYAGWWDGIFHWFGVGPWQGSSPTHLTAGVDRSCRAMSRGYSFIVAAIPAIAFSASLAKVGMNTKPITTLFPFFLVAT